MDPRLVTVLRTLMSIVMEPMQDPYAPPQDAPRTQYPAGSYGHFWEQLEGPRQHVTLPRVAAGGAGGDDADFANLTFFG